MRSLAALVMVGMMIMALFSEDQLAEAKVSKRSSQITFEMLNMHTVLDIQIFLWGRLQLV